MPDSQSYKSHTRWDPPFHFFVLPVLLLNIGFSIFALVRHWPVHLHLFGWWIVMSFALFILGLRSRQNALRVQDRIICLEERLRLAALLSAEELARSQALTPAQRIGLRFASDAELPGLVKRALAENLSQKAIKEAIVNWRPDYLRV